MPREALVKTLRRARERKGLTQVQLAAIIGTQQVSLWERGVQIPNGANVERLAAALDIDAGELHDLADAARAEEDAEHNREVSEVRADCDYVIGKLTEFIDRYETLATNAAIIVERALPLQGLFEGLSQQIEQTHQQLDRVDQRLAQLEQRLAQLEQRLAQLEQRDPPAGPPSAP